MQDRISRDNTDGHIVLRLEFPKDKFHAEQILDPVKGEYTTWLHFHTDELAEEVMQELKVEIMETLMVRLRAGQ